MARHGLDRVLRGAHKRVVEDAAAALAAPVRVEDARGKLLLGTAAEGSGERHPIVVAGEELGAVFGGAGADRLARLVAYVFERDAEKRGLADETLGRYKELTLLYDLSDKLSRVLDVDEVAQLVVDEAQRFLHGSGSAILMHDRRRAVLEPIASVGATVTLLAADVGLEGRVLRTGRAEFVEDVTTGDGPTADNARSVICAPLRSGESAFGLLRVTSERAAQWTAGDVKLVTALASHAASAISHAMLHRDQLRQQVLRSQIERFVSPRLVEAALEGHAGDSQIPVLFCDLGRLTHAGAELAPEIVLATLVEGRSIAMDVLMDHGATVNAAQGEMLVALFPSERGFADGARAAATAATALVRRLAKSLPPGTETPGVGIARTCRWDGKDPSAFFAGVGTAAGLQAAAVGRILVAAEVAEALAQVEHGSLRCVAVESPELARGMATVYEVRA